MIHRSRPAGLLLGSLGVWAVACLAAPGPPSKPRAVPSYEADILPLFRQRCMGCHGSVQPKAGLDVRTLGNLLQGGFSGPAVVPGAPKQSLVVQLLASGKMPPGSGRFTAAELKQVESWIGAGAKGKTAQTAHWAFRPPVRPTVPAVPIPYAPLSNPIDRFLFDALHRKGLSFSPPADKRTLLRRVTYDLIGLPPTPQETDAFLADNSPNAYEKVVDRLLADPRYGERWARHWLDTAGYADSEGVLEEDRIRPNAYKYRDYVIRSLNNDKPYDQFLREQIAGDELTDYRNVTQWTPEIEEAVTATGFLRTAVDATRDDFNTHQFTEYQYRMLNDTETILVSTTLGLTLQCARCHAHKYEPFSQQDYYRVQAILAGAIRPQGKLLPTNRRQIVAATAAEQKRAEEVNKQVTAAVQTLNQKEATLLTDFRLRALEQRLPEIPEADREPLKQAAHTPEAHRDAAQKALLIKYKAFVETPPDALAKTFPEFATQQKEIQQTKAAEEKKRIAHAEIRALYDQDATPPPTPVLLRGEWTKPGPITEPGIPSVLNDPRKPFRVPPPAPGATTTGRRKALAEWIARPDNPLTARVIVNRLWQYHFGVGLVASVENFGRSGSPPTHPELLDWLAATFVAKDEGGRMKDESKTKSSSFIPHPSSFNCAWSLMRLHRLMVTSRAYQQASAHRGVGVKVDPENRLLWRQRSRRLEAEAIRDAMLATTGTLDAKMYGEPVQTETRGSGEVVPVGEAGNGRRSIYLLVRRSRPVTLLNTFDAPIMETNCTRRITSTTATQALALLNSSFLDAQARHFAQRIVKETTAEPVSGLDSRRIEYAYRLAFGRTPAPPELSAAQSFLTEQSVRYRKSDKKAEAATEQALADFCLTLLSANEFVYVD